MTGELVGRERELALVAGLLERTQEGPAGLVLVGEAGIGKTVLWQQALQEAHRHEYQVLACRGVEAEARLSFAALGDLLADALPAVIEVLTPPRRRALEVALLIADPGSRLPDVRAVALAFLDGLRALARSGPVVLAVDDLQWLDAASGNLLAFALRRLRDEPVGLLATFRLASDGDQARVPTGLERLPFVEQARLGPLNLSSTYQLLKARLGLSLTRPQLVRLHEATRGNPLFALEVGRELQRSGGRGTPGQPLPVTADIRELLGRRLARLSAWTREVLLAVAAAARPSRSLLAAVLDDPGRVRLALEEADGAGIVDLDSDPVRFAHPLLASVSYETAEDTARREVHRRFAAVVEDPEERARHLALAAPGADSAVAAALDAAADHAARRGATATAAELLDLAVARTLPSDDSARRWRQLRAAEHHRLAGDRDRAAAILEEVLPEAMAGADRADVLFALARVRRIGLPAVVELCENALREAADDDARATPILTYLSWVRMLQADLRGALADARAGLVRAERVADPVLIARAIARVAMSETWTLEVSPGLLERGVRIEERLGRWLELHESPRWTLARRLICVDQLERARTLIEEADANALERGDEGTRGLILFFLISLEIHAGRWQRALQHVETALDLAEQLHDVQFHGMILNARAEMNILLGRVEEGRATIKQALAISDAVSDRLILISNLQVAGFLELSTGNLVEAARYLRALPAQLLSLGWNHPMVSAGWQDAIEVLTGLGEIEQARAYLESYEERAQRAAAPSALAIAARCRGLLAAAEGDTNRALEFFAQSLAHHAQAVRPFERGRTLLALGAVRRRARQKRAAREVLEEALRLFESLGAALWAEKARGELARIGGRRSAGEGLTGSEERIAALVARGLSNKEIAAALFVSVHTVEVHLTNVYRKLGLRSRGKLAAQLAAQRSTLGKD